MISLSEITEPGDELINFLISEKWEFHSFPVVDKDKIIKSISDGFYRSDEVKSYWIKKETGETLGFIRLFDLEDVTPLFDIRIKKEFRGLGFGKLALCKLVELAFTNFENVKRLEGYTREDNVAMISLFEKCGFVKEAHHRKSWEQSTGEIFDSVGYCILKEDWESGKLTPVNW